MSENGNEPDPYDFIADDDRAVPPPLPPRRPRIVTPRAKKIQTTEEQLASDFEQLSLRFPHLAESFVVEQVKPDVKQLSYCTICRRTYETRRKSDHRHRKHNAISATEAACCDVLDTLATNKLLNYEFDCRLLPPSYSQDVLDANKAVVHSLKSNGITVINEEYLNLVPFNNLFLPPQPMNTYQQPLHYNNPFSDQNGHNQYGQQQQHQYIPPIMDFSNNIPQGYQNVNNMYPTLQAPQPLYPSVPPPIVSPHPSTSALQSTNLTSAPLTPIRVMSLPSSSVPATPTRVIPPPAVDTVGPLISVGSNTDRDTHEHFFQIVTIDDVRDLSRDDPQRYTESRQNVDSKKSSTVRMKGYGFYRQLIKGQTTLLREYEAYINKARTIRTTGYTENAMKELQIEEATAMGGKQAYLAYVAKLGLIFLRCRNRGDKELSIDDVFCSGDIIQLVVDILTEKINHGPSTIMGYLKAILDFLEFIEKTMLIKPETNSRRKQACKNTKTRISNLLTFLRPQAGAQKTTNLFLGTSENRKFLRYGLSVQYVEHEVFSRFTVGIYNKLMSDPSYDCPKGEFNYLLGYLLLLVMVKSTSRNELCYKVKQGNMELKNMMEVMRGTEKIMVAQYPAPKQAIGRCRDQLLQGFFCLDKMTRAVVRVYEEAKSRRLARLEMVMSPGSLYFRNWKGEPLNACSTQYYMVRVQKKTGWTPKKIHCNQIRHTTAELDFDKWIKEFMAGGQITAPIAGHSAVTQFKTYDQERAEKVAVAFERLRTLAFYDDKQKSTLRFMYTHIQIVFMKSKSRFTLTLDTQY